MMKSERGAKLRGGAGRISRRQFLMAVAATSGSAAMLNMMAAMGQQDMQGPAAPPRLDGNGAGTKVIVLGAGPGGCPAAYELTKLGYDVTVLEARDRVGGHVWTIRNGSKGNEYGKGEQVCDWPDEPQFWWDAGPSRVPFYHRGFFHYCRELNIPLIDHKNLNLNGYCYAENIAGGLNGKKMRLHEMQADMGGYTSQYLASALDAGSLDEDLSTDDVESLREYLLNYGILDSSDFTYKATDHRGYTVLPDTSSHGKVASPYAPADLFPFASAIMEAAGGYLAATAVFDWQTTLVKPKGGMDKLYVDGFARALGDRIKLNSEVTRIQQDENGVTITYKDTTSGEEQQIAGDYCICNIPPSVLVKIQSDFSPAFREATRQVPYAMSVRMGIGYKRRFWEEDDWIYGGQSFTNISPLGILGYPDDNYHAKGGVMLGLYNFDTDAALISSFPYDIRAKFALDHGSKVHPQMRDEFISAFSVAWHLEPYSLGAWPTFDTKTRQNVMPVLQEPDGRVYLVGEHLSYVNAWMEGAVQAAWTQVEKLHKRVMAG